jgi:hypothetical protein
MIHSNTQIHCFSVFAPPQNQDGRNLKRGRMTTFLPQIKAPEHVSQVFQSSKSASRQPSPTFLAAAGAKVD